MNKQTRFHKLMRAAMPFLLIAMLILTSLGASAFNETRPVQIGQAAPPLAPSLSIPALDALTPADSFGVQTTGTSQFLSGGATVKAAGANFVRMLVRWKSLAPTDIEPTSYNWTSYDAAMALAVSEGYEVIIELDENPPWAASFERGPVDCVPLSRHTDFVSAVVTRYSAPPYNVKYWEIYNEPDVVSFTWPSPDCSGDTDATAFGDHPADYVTTLAASHGAIKAIDSDAIVLLGAVAYDWFTTEGGVFVESFLDDILTLGAANYFDVMNFHYYAHSATRWEIQTGLPGARAKTAAVQEILADNNVDKPIVCTELGASSGDAYHAKTEDTQAIAVITQFAQSIAAGNKISIWYLMADYGYDNFFAEFGLLDVPGYAPKLALDAYATLSTALVGFEYISPLEATEMGATNMEGYIFWDQPGGEALYILWSADGSSQTITLPPGVTSVVDKFGDPVSYSSTLGIDEQPVLITQSVTFQYLFLPLIMR